MQGEEEEVREFEGARNNPEKRQSTNPIKCWIRILATRTIHPGEKLTRY